MLSKLAARNARRSMRDYLIYLVTMAAIAALMFAFDSMIFSEDILKLYVQGGGMMAAMIAIATFFIIFIIAWLIHYMIRFMLEKRSREFGTYMLLGMKKKEISKLFIRENGLLGIVAFLLGILPGIFLQQVLTVIFYSIYGRQYHLSVHVSGWGFLLTICLYGLVYFFALLRNKRQFKKMNIHDLIYLDKQNEKLHEKTRKASSVWFIVSLIYFVIFAVFLFTGEFTLANVWPMIAVLIVCVYLFYVGFSGMAVSYIERKGKRVYKGSNLFLFRQMASKIKTMRFTMGTLTILFTAALIGCSVAMMFGDFQQRELDAELPFDVIVFSDQTNDDFTAQREVLEKETKVKDQMIYRIYENGSTAANDYLYENLPYFQQTKPLKEKYPDEGENELFDYDTYMKLSDYNKLRHMLGFSKVSLDEDQYLIQTKERIRDTMEGFAEEKPLRAGEKELSCKGISTIPFSQSGENGADYLLVVPDSAAASMKPFYSLMAVDIVGKAPNGLQEKLAKTQNYEDEDTSRMNMRITWGFGTNQVVTMADTVLVQTNLLEQTRFIITAVCYPLFYISIVFLCVAMTILSVQQLGDAAKYKFRYQVLSKLGLNEKEIDKVVLKQLSIYYLCPVLVAAVMSGVISVFASHKFIFYTGINTPVLFYYGISLAFFMGVYLIYFIATYIEFRRNIWSGR
ncbi:ABC transporter permease [Anaerovorax odorimutans]|uniref:ABC transporter permease n=1 Tax=Anaerovorax odorimutans TaxID=109327 RepID=A0ABT1RRY2_9FIRM|nr:ABC transporter permease [Anaerovorax odorimutans]MCQ4637970.1 ABC transporter permease [Anaerovorax odorimutans]